MIRQPSERRIHMRRYVSSSVVVALAALVGLAVLPSAHPATTQACRGTLTLETITILSDTDVDEFWPVPDRWTYHIYAIQNGLKTGTGVKYFRGNTGKVATPDLRVQSKIVGNIGDSVT